MPSRSLNLAVAVVGLMASCSRGDGPGDDSTTYEVCKLDDAVVKASSLEICTEEFKSAKIADGKSCYYTECKLQTNGGDDCPTYFVKGKSSTTPTEDFCSYSRPIDL